MSDIYVFIAKPGIARFFRQERERDVRYLVRHYGVAEDAADECFCKGCHAMLDNIHQGRLTPDSLTSSLEAYLLACCRNQLLKQMAQDKRLSGSTVLMEEAGSWSEDAEETCFNEQGDWVDISTEQHESDLRLMEKIVVDLPSPCEDLIWGKYRRTCKSVWN